MSSWSRTTVAAGKRAPSWPRWTGLKERTGWRLTAPAAIEHVREGLVHDVALVGEPGLLHHPSGSEVVRERERDYLRESQRPEGRLDGRERQLGRKALPPPLGHDRPRGFDLV